LIAMIIETSATDLDRLYEYENIHAALNRMTTWQLQSDEAQNLMDRADHLIKSMRGLGARQ